VLGAHVSVAGGLDRAPANGLAIGAQAIQIFTRNQRQWSSKPVTPEEAGAYRQAFRESGLAIAVAHASYLINLASPAAETLERSRAALAEELARCEMLGIPHAIVHPGAHMGAGDDAGLATVARSLDDALRRSGSKAVSVLVEITAGQGTCVGHRFEHLAEILSRATLAERLGVCLDTCHMFASGYDIASPRGFEHAMDAFDRVVGFARLCAVHVNDAAKGLGSRRDRHAAIGKGLLGRATFRRILGDTRLRRAPLLLETPGPEPVWKREIALLRRLSLGRLTRRSRRRRPTARGAR
jgi:deoxyribonuclease-4